MKLQKLHSFIEWLAKPKNLWWSIFAYTILSGLFVQLILLPHIFPSWHPRRGVSGLLTKMDGQKFHRIALTLSESIEEKGWSQWELLPAGQLVSGIAAIFYVVIFPAPWSVLPLNAVLNASGCLCMFLVMANILQNRSTAVITSLPFIFFPSNLLWNTQFHNENYAIPGVIFILYGWLLVIGMGDKHGRFDPPKFLKAMALIICGSLLIGLVRVYILSGIVHLSILAGVTLGGYWFFLRTRVQDYLMKIIPLIMVCSAMYITLATIQEVFPDTRRAIAGPASDREENEVITASVNRGFKWEDSRWLPGVIDKQFKLLAKYRREVLTVGDTASSNIDTDIRFQNAEEVLAYVPRAMQIALLSPFPNLWFSEGRNDAGTAMRIASAFEMMVIYFLLFGLPVFFWSYRKEPVIWVLSFICMAMLIIYAIVISNIGSLYRFRYPYLMPLVCFGLAGWIRILESHLTPLQQKTS